MKKRIFALLLAAVMLMNAFPAHALEGHHNHTHTHNQEGPTFVVETVHAAAGETVDVAICLVNNPGITSIKLEVEYDDALTLQGVTPNADLGNNFLKSPDGRYPVILNWYDGLNDITGDWDFAVLHFQVAEDAAPGAYNVSISFDPNDIFDANEDNLDFGIENGGVVVEAEGEEPMPGEAAFVVDTVTAVPGETVDVAIRLRNNPGITSIKLSVEHPNGVDGISLVSVTPNPDLGSNFLKSPDGVYPMILNWYDGLNNVTGDWIFATLRFSIPAGLPAFTYPITVTFNPDDVYDVDENNVEFIVENGAIVVEGSGECNHSYLPMITEPTCLEGGYTTYTCVYCGDTYVADETAALGHDWDEGVVTVEPTETSEGIRLHTCVRCGATEERPIAPIDHVHNYDAVVTEPTCTEQGYTTHTCRCGDSYIDSYVPALGHDLGDWTVVTPAGCETEGLERRACSRCDYAEENVIPAIGHNYEAVVTEPTCLEGGYTTYTCANCGDSYVADETAALGHEWDEGVVTVEPTETSEGIRLHTCVRCGATEERPIAPIDHVHNYEAVVTEPTCTEQGYTTHTCRCGDSYIDSYTDALGHNMSQWAVTVEPGCETAGLEITECVRDGCDYEETREVEPLGHDLGDWTVVTPAGCETDGLERRTCSRCDYAEENVISAIGHNYEAVVTEPTCLEGGYTTYTCANCGHSYVADETAALGHEWDEGVVTVEPTETSEGIRLHTCVRCGATEERTIAPLDHEHAYQSVVTEPTCTEQGYTTHTCRCGDSYIDSYVPALGHDLGGWTVVTPAGCETEGLERRACSRCDYAEENVLPATGHNYEAVVTEPTCLEGGYTTYTCANCGHSYVADETAALGHEWDEGVVTVEPTETSAGVRLHTCVRCGATEERTIAPLDHEHAYQSVVTEPTCTEQGYTTHTCRCGDSYIDSYVPALGHDMGEWTVVTPAGCTTEGKVLRTCSRCGYSEEDAIEATGHNYEAVVTEPTCEENGYTTYTCANCGDSYVADETAALGHDWDEGVVTVEPTETSAGVRLHTCVRCGATEERTIAPLDHEHAYQSVVTEPTCTEQGYTTHTCRCGDSYIDSYVPALGHDMGEWTVVTPAGCTTEGKVLRTCSRCGYSEEDVIEATGHNYEAVVTEPTCEENGYTTYTCANCGDSYVADETAALGHEWDEGVVTVEPTEESAGIRLHTCVRCGATEERTIAPLDHEHAYQSVVTEPTCTEQGYTTHTCRCGDSYIDSYVDALGHDMGEWTVVTPAGCVTEGQALRTCSRCGESEETVLPAVGHQWEDPTAEELVCIICGYVMEGYPVTLSAEQTGAVSSVWVDGVEYPVTPVGDSFTVNLPNTEATNLVIYSMYEGATEDVHTQYPVGMKVWMLKYENGAYTATYVPEFDNLLQYAGSSIRIVGNKGIRMITAIDKSVKNALTSSKGLAGYTLLEYGTALSWAADIVPGQGLTLGQEYTKSNYAYKKGVADPVFKNTATQVQYTNVLVGFDNDQCIPDIAMRPYIIVQDAEGNQVTIYGGVIYRSIGYIAYQNRAAFAPKTAAYEYVWAIIHHVYGDRFDAEYKK